MTTHVDDFIDEPCFNDNEPQETYAKWMLFCFRLPASLKISFKTYLPTTKLFGVYEDKKYRITGASRMGDVWITSDFNQTTGYEQRVSVDKISQWSDK